MPNLTRFATAALFIGLFALPAAAAGVTRSPVGSWKTSDGQARVKVTLCGDGSQLCARLTDLSGKARTAENLELLNSYVVEKAELADANVWQGLVHFNGETAPGNIVLQSANHITVRGCRLGLCKSLEFKRI